MCLSLWWYLERRGARCREIVYLLWRKMVVYWLLVPLSALVELKLSGAAVRELLVPLKAP